MKLGLPEGIGEKTRGKVINSVTEETKSEE
jgi:hypothetical protein